VLETFRILTAKKLVIATAITVGLGTPTGVGLRAASAQSNIPRPPGPVVNAVADFTPSFDVTITWSPPVDAGDPVASYYFVRGLTSLGFPVAYNVPATQTSIGFTPSSDRRTNPQSYDIYACRGDVPTNPLAVGDCGPPVVAYLPITGTPGPITLNAVTATTADLGWVPSLFVPKVPFVEYRVQLDGGETRPSTTPRLIWTGLTPNTSHRFAVQGCYVRSCGEFSPALTVTTASSGDSTSTSTTSTTKPTTTTSTTTTTTTVTSVITNATVTTSNSTTTSGSTATSVTLVSVPSTSASASTAPLAAQTTTTSSVPVKVAGVTQTRPLTTSASRTTRKPRVSRVISTRRRTTTRPRRTSVKRRTSAKAAATTRR
jgi:hypothetical protein